MTTGFTLGFPAAAPMPLQPQIDQIKAAKSNLPPVEPSPKAKTEPSGVAKALNDLGSTLTDAWSSAVKAEIESTHAANDAALMLQDDAQAYNSAEALLAWQRGETSAVNAHNRAIDLMQRQYDLNKELSGTEMQRRVADLKAAGLNPALAITQLSGANASVSASSGAQGTASAASSGASSAHKANAVGAISADRQIAYKLMDVVSDIVGGLVSSVSSLALKRVPTTVLHR